MTIIIGSFLKAFHPSISRSIWIWDFGQDRKLVSNFDIPGFDAISLDFDHRFKLKSSEIVVAQFRWSISAREIKIETQVDREIEL